MTAELTRTGSPGQEFAAAVFAASEQDVTVALPCALPATFPFAANRPRYTVRHLLKTREVTEPLGYLREEHLGSDISGTSFGATPEARFSTSISTAAITTLTASLSVPRDITANEETLATVVDHRLIVRLCTVENDALLNGTEDGVIHGIRALAGTRRAKPCTEDLLAGSSIGTDLGKVITETAALVEETGGSCDGVIGHPRLYWELVRTGLLSRLAEAGMRVSRTRMLPPEELILADFRAAFTLLDTLDSTMELRRGAGADGQDLLIASVRIGLAVHLPQHVILGAISW